jgi:hypothetical protein
VVVEVHELNWAIPHGWHLDRDEPDYIWGRGPGGDPQRRLLEEVVARALCLHLHPLRSRVDVHTEQALGRPSWRMNPRVARMLMRLRPDVGPPIVHLELDGGTSLFGWPIDLDPTRPPAHGDPRTWPQGAYPYVELGWTVTSGPTD